MSARSGNMTKGYAIKHQKKLSFKILIIVTVALAAVCLANTVSAGSAAQGNFVAGLTGGGEVPTVHTNATGSASFLPTLDAKIRFMLNVTDIENVTKADIHVGKEGKNGPTIITIFSSETLPVRVNGTLTEGNITSANLQGPIKGKQLFAFIDILQHGDAYVNVATKQNPNGEIRGQIGFEGIDESGKGLGEKSLTLADQGLQFE